jgi:hypothetical protein
MALTRKYLQGMGLTEEQVDAIIESNEETIKGLKSEIARYKADAEGKEEIQKELDELKKKKPEDDPTELEKVKKDLADKTAEFEKYKADIDAKETKVKKEDAYRKLLKEAGIGEKYFDIVVKASQDKIDSIAFDKEGKVKDSDKITAETKESLSAFVVTTQQKGAVVSNPPGNNNGGGSEQKPSRAAELFKQHTESMYGNKDKEE